MKKRYCVWLLTVLTVLMLSACKNSAGNEEKNQSIRTSAEKNTQSLERIPKDIAEESSTEKSEDNNVETGTQMPELIIRVDSQQFQATLYDNNTVHAFIEKLPITLNMEELHGNEKFYYLDEGLPQNSEQIDGIQAGDIMLFGSDCLVLFYEDFSTSYNYTRIGHVEDKEAFADALGDGTVEVSFETGE